MRCPTKCVGVYDKDESILTNISFCLYFFSRYKLLLKRKLIFRHPVQRVENSYICFRVSEDLVHYAAPVYGLSPVAIPNAINQG